MLLKMDSSDQNSLHLPGVLQVSALWLTQAGLCSKIWLSSQRSGIMWFIPCALHPYLTLQTRLWTDSRGKKNKQRFQFLNLLWSSVECLGASPNFMFRFQPGSLQNPHDTDPTSSLSLISFQHQNPGRARTSPLSRLILTDNCIYCFLFTSQ